MRAALLMALLATGAQARTMFRSQLGGTIFTSPPRTNLTVDYSASLFLAGPATAAQCTNGSLTTDQGGAVTLSRASAAYCQKDDGTYVLVSSGKPVVEGAGLRVEPASTNLITDSEDVTWWDESNVGLTSDTTDPTGGVNNAHVYATTSAGGFLFSNTMVIAGTVATLSAWTQNGGAVDGALILRDTTAGVNRCTITIAHGSVAWQTTMTGRASCSSSSIVSGNNHEVRWYMGGLAGSGTAGSVWGVQVEALGVKTSYIPTNRSTASRSSDDASITVTDFNTAGCVSASVTNVTSVYQGGVVRWFNASGGSPLGSTNSTTLSMHDNATAATLTVADISNRTTSARSQWSGSSMFIQSGGSTGATGSFDGTEGTGGVLTLGSAGGGSAAIGGWMKAIKFSNSPGGCQ